VSAYFYFSFHFVMREDQSAAQRALAAVAARGQLGSESLADIHPVAGYFLEKPERFLDDEAEPRVGTPVRLAHDGVTSQPRLSIELCMHDDRFADGGYMFWVWLLSLVQPPSGNRRGVIGYDGLYRNDSEMGFTVATAQGITDRHGNLSTYRDIQQQLSDWSSWEAWCQRMRGA